MQKKKIVNLKLRQLKSWSLRRERKNKGKNKQRINDVWDTPKQASIRIMGFLEKDKREKGIERVFGEMM